MMNRRDFAAAGDRGFHVRVVRTPERAAAEPLGEAGPSPCSRRATRPSKPAPRAKSTAFFFPANREELTRPVRLDGAAGNGPASALLNRATRLTALSGFSIVVDGFDGINVGCIEVVQPDVIIRGGVLHFVHAIIKPA